jgi:NAD-dependent dihydropyrimidine dehydrogenase PreA subunit
MAIENIDKEICTGCGICISICPQDVIRMNKKSRKATIKYSEDCVACWTCEVFCPVDAINVSLSRPMKIPSPWLGLLEELS